MKTYEIIQSEAGTIILRKPDNACIPTDPANSDYQEYLAWLEKPETPEAENN